jgi:aldehyde:ferredoxin oxidoreductase
VAQPNDFYRALARGVEHAASVYGGADFALAFGGNEMPGYHTGPACHLTHLTGARHSHLDSAGYSLDQKAGKTGETLTPEGVATALLEEERWRQVLASLVVCFFARGVYTPEAVLGGLAAVGRERSIDDLTRLGVETLRRKYAFKVREGFDPAGLRIPRRILETPSPVGSLNEDFLRLALARIIEGL